MISVLILRTNIQKIFSTLPTEKSQPQRRKNSSLVNTLNRLIVFILVDKEVSLFIKQRILTHRRLFFSGEWS
jgi:hypothetical protein